MNLLQRMFSWLPSQFSGKTDRAVRYDKETPERKYYTLFALSRDGIGLCDLNGRFLDANQAFCAMLGYSFAELCSRSTADIVPARWQEVETRIMRDRVLADGFTQEFEQEYVRKDGTVFPVSVCLLLIRDAKGKPTGVWRITRDISERKATGTAVRRPEEWIAGIVNSAMDAIITVDVSQRIVQMNPAAEAMFGAPARDLLGEHIDRCVPSRYREQHRKHVTDFGAKADHSGQIHGQGVVYGLRANGEEFPIEGSISHMEIEGNPFYTVILRDLSERLKTEEQMRVMNVELERRVAERTAELEATNRELEAFNYSVSHDLRAPLRAVEGFSAILLEKYRDQVDEEGAECLRHVHGGTLRMGRLIEDLLSLSRVTQTAMHVRGVDLTRMAEAVLEELRLRDPGRVVRATVAPGMVARGDENQLRIVLENLIGNAWKFTSRVKEPRIHVGSEIVGSGTVYYVRDNGAGFDMAYADKLFGAFQRLHSVAEFEGTGIGLATVQRIIHRHHGEVWAEARENEGATFFFSLPPHS
jgi:PAS domain S-box-containing protein